MSEPIRIISPVDGSVYAERPCATEREVTSALAGAARAQSVWRDTSIDERATVCTAMVDAMLAMERDIVNELAWQMGRPIRYGAGELIGFEERARHMIDIAGETLAPIVATPKAGFTRYVRREPLGIVLVIAPWNYPYLTAVNSIVPALMAGNAVLLKHASQTLLVGERFQRAADGVGLPCGLFRNIVLSHDQTERMLASSSVNQLNFTGSVSGGRRLERAAAGTFTGLGLELGGKDPAFVMSDADLQHAVENLVDGAFFNSGQSCCGIERIYVAADVYKEFLDRFVTQAQDYILGNPLENETTLGPMVRPAAADFVRSQVTDALNAGAIGHIDPASFPLDALGSQYMAPQVLSRVDHTMRVMTEESFGPVIGVMSVSSDDDAIRLMNASDYGLTASLWTRDLGRAEKVGSRLETGTVFMNRCDYLDPALAWTGVKNTGRGATLSPLGYEHLTRPKSFHFRHAD